MTRPNKNGRASVRPNGERVIIGELHRLCGKLHLAQAHRVEFVCLALQHGLDSDIRHYRLWDEGWEGLGDRQWDNCFENGDAEEVIAQVVARARQGNFLESVRRYCNMPGAYERWLACADRQSLLF